MNAPAFALHTGTSVEQAEARLSRYERTFRSMLPFMPDECSEFLDIGCGLGGVAMLVSRHYGGRARANLIDGWVDQQLKWTGYRADGQPWADVRVALRLYVKHCQGMPVEAYPPEHSAPVPPCELIYSNCSLGHHYPIEAYLELLVRTLKPRGRLIVDLRVGEVGEHGREVLDRFFQYAGAIETSGVKYQRTVWSNE